jgi:hypothetical protein
MASAPKAVRIGYFAGNILELFVPTCLNDLLEIEGMSSRFVHIDDITLAIEDRDLCWQGVERRFDEAVLDCWT